MKTTEILETATKLVGGDRQNTHGDKYENHKNIAILWNGYLDGKLVECLTPENVAIMMALLKVARTKAGAHNEDDYVDAAAYMAIACDVHRDEDN